MTQADGGDRVDVLVTLEREPDGRVGVHVQGTSPPADYGTVELADLTVLLEAVLDAVAEGGG